RMRARGTMSRQPSPPAPPGAITYVVGPAPPVASCTSRAIWIRFSTASFARSRETCALTVATLMCSSAAISAFARPAPTATETARRAWGASHAQSGGAPRFRAAGADREGALVLARGQRREPLPRALAACGPLALARHEGDEPPRHRGRQHGVAGVHELDRAHD